MLLALPSSCFVTRLLIYLLFCIHLQYSWRQRLADGPVHLLRVPQVFIIIIYLFTSIETIEDSGMGTEECSRESVIWKEAPLLLVIAVSPVLPASAIQLVCNLNYSLTAVLAGRSLRSLPPPEIG